MRRVIAIAGGSGSGKSALAASLAEAFGLESLAMLSLDAYYHDLSHLAYGEREQVNFDHPDALDLDCFAGHIFELLRGRSVDCPTYDFTAHCRQPCTVRVDSRDNILVEGILVATRADLRLMFDELIFVATDTNLRWHRRVERDQRARGRDLASIKRFWDRAEATFDELGSLAKEHASLVIDGGRDLSVITAEVLEYLDVEPKR